MVGFITTKGKKVNFAYKEKNLRRWRFIVTPAELELNPHGLFEGTCDLVSAGEAKLGCIPLRSCGTND
jgi:hypothetical protein